ncbi:DltE [Arthrobacter sp. ERGS1:01]|uniref:SDR family oxidoreductase n=1 Tax=Arthrobacter sp. ERGS1:01 TaxID=1704044 RepID=UPI0006B5DDD1|nr:SDR family NAD(P)-dependent oxidoreductase [Arthrobacter sp. ERGS1:01]ALE04870.1 DltE [Arthrobacter sp. ERGS1:01]
MKISKNTIFIAGGTSGIGLEVALRLTDEGNKVIVGGRRLERLEEIRNSHPTIGTVGINVDDKDSIRHAYEEVTASHPDLNVLITMSGIMEPENLKTPDFLQVAERTVTTNILGTIRLVAQFIPFLSTKDSAAILTISSALAFVPLPITPTYNASKAAIHMFTESMRVQLADTSIQCIEIAPPGVRTTMMGQENSESAMPIDAFVAEVISLLKANPEAKEIVVEAAAPLRNAEINGNYDEILTMLS